MIRVVNLAALFLLIGVVALRPLISETYDAAETSISRALGDVGDSSPLRTIGFNVVVLVCAAAVFLTNAGRGPERRIGSAAWAAGFALLIVAGVISCWLAGQKRLAINATIDWLCFPILTLTLVLLLSERWARQLLLSAVIGSACVLVWQCYEQYFFTFEETIQKYEAEKEAFWARQGVNLESSKVVMFEARMRARQATGFMPHSNVAASFLVLTGFAITGLIATRWRKLRGLLDWPRVLSLAGTAVVAAGIFAVVPLTGSRGAMLSAVVAGILWILCSVLRDRIERHRRRLFLAAWGAIIGGTLAVIAYGTHHGSLPGVSLMFRWQYWSASAAMIADHPWTGVGRENFGRHYLTYKSIESPEEVANPHNLFVQAATDWGWPGFVAMVLMLFGASRMIVFRPSSSNADAVLLPSRRIKSEAQGLANRSESTAPPTTRLRATGWLWFLGLSAFVLGARVPLLGTDDFFYLYYMTATACLAWSFGFLSVWLDKGNGSAIPLAALDSRTISTGIAFGLLAFLVHDIINFALFVPATATVFFALLAIPLSEYHESEKEPTKSSPHGSGLACWWPGLGLAVATVAVIYVAAWPVAAAQSSLRAARSTSSVWQADKPIEKQPAYLAFSAAAEADRLDPTPLMERAQWLAGVADVAPTANLREEALRLAAASVAAAQPRDPQNVGVYRLRMNVYLRLAAVTQQEADFLKAIEAAREALARYPQDPHGLAALADAQAAAGRTLNRDDLLREAINNFRRALELDGQRLEWETLRRFQPGERIAIERQIAELVMALEPR